MLKIAAVGILVFCYLFFSYIRFYNFIGEIDLKSPYTLNPVVLENTQGEGVYKYIALGDSLSAGVGSPSINDTFTYLYAKTLSESCQKVNVLNLAQPGGTTVDVIYSQLPRSIEENPNFITLLIGTNDIHNKRTIKDFRDKYSFILNELLTKTTAQITVINIPYLGSNKLVFPPFNFLLDVRTRQFNKVIYDLVSTMNVDKRLKFIDLYKSTYKLSKENPKYYSSDLFHPSGEGYVIWGNIINAN